MYLIYQLAPPCLLVGLGEWVVISLKSSGHAFGHIESVAATRSRARYLTV